jgi:hypothetical protein
VAFGFAAIAVSLATGWGLGGEVRARRKLYPDQPWRWVKRWDGGRIEAARERGRSAGMVVFALFVIAAVLGAGFLLFQGPPHKDASFLLALLAAFGMIGLILLGIALRNLAAAVRFTPAVFQMSTMPGRIGGRLSGTIEAPANLPPGGEAVVILKCLRQSGAGSPSHRQMAKTLWQEEQRLSVTTSRLPIAFAIPPELPGTTPATTIADHYVFWRLRVTADVPGADWSAEFDVPVFQTKATGSGVEVKS